MDNTTKLVWEGDGGSLLSQWFFEDGDDVEKGDLLCELMQEKVAVEVEAPVSGKLLLFPNPIRKLRRAH